MRICVLQRTLAEKFTGEEYIKPLLLGDLRTVEVCSHRRTRGTRSEIIIHLATKLIVELKSVEHASKLQIVQLLTYMKLAEAPIGLLINFNVPILKQGIKKCAITKFSAYSEGSCVK